MDEELSEQLEEGIVELCDDEGNVIKFKLLDVTEYKGQKYVLLLPAEPNAELAEDEVTIFRLEEDGATMTPVDDDGLMQDIYDFYCSEEEDGD